MNNIAIVQTLDFIAPIVDNPYDYACIAAANSLSDIFAMGARAISAMNIVGFSECLPRDMLKDMLLGLNDKIIESGAICAGGHTLNSSEVFLGLSVTGVVGKNDFLSNNTAKINDVLIATKPLGTSLSAMAIKANFNDDFSEVINGMKTLNLKAINALKDIKINACTDITGFGLIGHLSEMLNDDISIEVDSSAVKFYKNTFEYANLGLFGAVSYNNKDSLKNMVRSYIDDDLVFYSPETSGGLILSVKESDVDKILDILNSLGTTSYSFAKVVARNDSKISIY